MDQDLRFPVGRFHEADSTPAVLTAALEDIEALPTHLRRAVAGLADAQLDTPYRPGGWTIRQVVHHVADSHINALIRLKLALTEDNPTIKPYNEKAWAEMPDMRMPVEISLALLDALHARWITVGRAVTSAQIHRTVFHPEQGRTLTVGYLVQMYAWHSRHHVAHITALRQRERW